MLTREIAIKTINDVIIACKENHKNFNKLIRFGSTVSGDTNATSDIDLLLVSDQFG